MKQDRSQATARAEAIIHLARQAEAGQLDNLVCPECGSWSVAVWFTNQADGIYRTWFICSACKFYSRAQNTTSPSHFPPDRVRADLQERDREILRNRKF